jgi:hypothetical protein
MNGAVHAAAAQQGGVGCVHNCVDVKLRDVSLNSNQLHHLSTSLHRSHAIVFNAHLSVRIQESENEVFFCNSPVDK